MTPAAKHHVRHVEHEVAEVELALASAAAGTADRRGSERRAEGKAQRAQVPRSSHGGFTPAQDRPDPVQILVDQGKERLTDLLPIRYGRMLASPFAFYRGAAAVMAADLAPTPQSGWLVQACGDAHLANFGVFGAPDGTLVFDVNDFDETFPAPWEWDVKRMAASTVLAARENGRGRDGADVALASVAAYRTAMAELAGLTVLERWRSVVKVDEALRRLGFSKKFIGRLDERAARHTSSAELPKLTTLVGDQREIVEHPPLVVRLTDQALRDEVATGMAAYEDTLSPDLQVLLRRFTMVDVAIKVVGVGSVGTRALMALYLTADGDPLFLQMKEAVASVLEPYVGLQPYDHQGQRVVLGQRLMQTTGDPLLGWSQSSVGRQFYVRQLRDMKVSPNLENATVDRLLVYAQLCGRVLARAHARTGDPLLVAGYLGRSDAFDEAVSSFAVAYADQTERDHAALAAAVKAGTVRAETGV